MTNKFVWFDEKELFDGYLLPVTETEDVMFLDAEYNPTGEHNAIYKRVIPLDGSPSYFEPAKGEK